jgi:cytochrome c-type biogenesis protein CcmH
MTKVSHRARSLSRHGSALLGSAIAGLFVFAAACSQNTEDLDSSKPVPPPPPTLEQQLGTPPANSAAQPPSGATAASPGVVAVDRGIPPGITGEVTLAPEYADKIQPGAVLYVIARAPGGPPIAARKIDDPTFPMRFFLGQESVMFEGQSLEGEVDLSARIAQHGSAGPAEPGDLSGQCADNPVKVGNSTPYTINLDTLH